MLARNLSAFIRVHLRLTLFLVCGLLLFGLWLLQVNPYLNVANDAGRYMVLGESLARTGDLRLLNEARRPLDTLYPPGYPALIAFWLLVTGREPGGVVLLVKCTQLLLMLCALPLLYRLLEKARLPLGLIAAALVTFALCPAAASYANDVMSEAAFLFLCLASVVLVERDARPSEEDERPPGSLRMLSLLCTAGAFLVRTAGVALFMAQVAWFWRRFGWKWGAMALAAMLLTVGGWQWRDRHIRRTHPNARYVTYMDQFTLRDPATPKAGRITLDAKGLTERARVGLPTYVGMIPRAVLHMMAPPQSPWLVLFYLLAVPMTLLILLGFVVGCRRGLWLSGGFTLLFWLFAAMWPWRSPRFLVPLLPFLALYLFLGVEVVSARLRSGLGVTATRAAQGMAAALLLIYFGRVHAAVIRSELGHAAGYALGRSPAEGGFYAACAWLKTHAPPGSLVMGRPAYLLHLYADRPTTQIEPNVSPRVQELAYMKPRHVRYLVQDAWPWSHTDAYIAPYLRAYADKWRLAWQDPRGSGVRLWERLPGT